MASTCRLSKPPTHGCAPSPTRTCKLHPPEGKKLSITSASLFLLACFWDGTHCLATRIMYRFHMDKKRHPRLAPVTSNPYRLLDLFVYMESVVCMRTHRRATTITQPIAIRSRRQMLSRFHMDKKRITPRLPQAPVTNVPFEWQGGT